MANIARKRELNIGGGGILRCERGANTPNGDHVEKHGKHKTTLFNEQEVFDDVDIGNGCESQKDTEVFRQPITAEEFLIQPDGNTQKQ